ncbi:hypothetical protein J3A83DRAFT_4366792 [Scleroderma citrinum]
MVSLEVAENAFRDLNTTLPDQLQVGWEQQEQKALQDRIQDPKAMDIFDVQLQKALSIKSIEMDLMDTQGLDDDLWDSATWIAHGFNIEEAQITLKLDAHQMSLQATESQ